MAVPSSLYAEDENARQTLANGTVLKWTKQLENIHALNAETDLSISYTNWANEPMMTHANRGFHQWQGGCVSGGDLGYNQSTGFGYLHATGIKQLESGQPRIDSLQTHVVLSNGGGYYVWGYNPEASSRINGSNGNQRRYLLDMDINKMIFTCTITVVDKSFFDNVDFATNPGNMPTPSEHNITLKELFTHPELYYCTGVINWSNTYVYGENTSDHWRGVAIRPAILLTGETIGEYQGADDSIFGRFTSNGNFSYDSRDPNGHASFGGGGSSNTLYNRMNAGYFMGCKNEIDMTPTDTFDSAGGASTSIAINKWGNTNFSRFAYCNGQIFDYGDSVVWCAWGTGVINNTDTGSRYKDYTFGTRRYIKADKMLKYIASFGLYFMSESFDPDSVNLTPETLGDDSRIMLGEMSADGTTTGRWITDIDSYTGPNKDGKTSNPDYDPSGGGGGGGGGYDDDPWHGISFSGVGVGGAGAFAKCYYMTSTELANLRSWMNSNNVPEGFDPMQQIIGLSQVPVTLSGDDNTTVQFVNSSAVYDPGVTRLVDSGVKTQISMGTPKRYSLGSVNITRRMQERGEPYLDYDCQIELYLPLIGMFSLDTQAVMGRTITAEAVLDPISGTLAAYAYVSRDGQNLPIAYGSTTIGVDLPISVQQLSVSRAALKQANAQLGTSLLSSSLSFIAAATAGGKGSGTGAKTATGSTNGLAAAGIREAGADYMKASQAGNVFGDFMQWGRTIRQLSYGNNTAIAGSFGGSTAQWSYPFTPYVKIIRPRYEKPDNYKHSQGVPCVQAKTVGSCTGFIQCIGVDVSGITGATDIELQAIQAALTNGVYAGGGS